MIEAPLVAPDGEILCPHVVVADSAATRMRGLLGRDSLGPGDALLLRPAGSVHTAFMRFPIDVVFLDREMRVLRVEKALRPWRMAGQRGARAVLEMAAGAAERSGIVPGMSVALGESAE